MKTIVMFLVFFGLGWFMSGTFWTRHGVFENDYLNYATILILLVVGIVSFLLEVN